MSHSPLEDTSVALAEPPPRLRVDAGYAALQACAGDLPDVRLLGGNYILFGVYHDWVHQNPENNLDDGTTKYGKGKDRWKVHMYANTTLRRTIRKFGRIFVGTLYVDLNGVRARKWNSERVIIF